MTNQLQLNNVTVTARGKPLVQDASLSLREGEFVALIGPNGAGKTTLLRAALGLARCDGEVLINDRPAKTFSGRERAGVVGWLPQQALVAEPITVAQLVTAARYRFSETHAQSHQESLTALKATRAEAFADRPVTELSGGEQQRVAVAALIAQEAPLLLLDEPANHLDPAQQIDLYGLIGRLWREGRGVLCITHDVNMLRHVGEGPGPLRVVGMRDGRIQFESSYNADELPQQMGSLFNVPMQVVNSGPHRLLIPGGAA